MRSKPWGILILIALVLAGAAGCHKKGEKSRFPSGAAGAGAASSALAEAKGVLVLAPDSPLLTQIKVETVAAATVSVNEVSAPGRIEFDAVRVGRVHLPVSGRIERVLVRLGDAVRAGQPVLTVDSPEAEVAVSAYRQSLAAVIQARANLAKVTADRNRVNDLFEHKAAARKEVMAAENDLALAQAAADQAEAARDQSRRRLEILGLGQGESGSRLTIAAPLSGKVIELAVTAGEYRSDTADPVVTVADLSAVWVLSEIPEASIRLIETGERIQIELVAYPGEVFEARVTRIADTLDPKTRTVQVRAELANPGGRLRPGMFGRIRHMHAAKPLPVIPARAVYRRGSDDCVFIERGTGRFERIRISLGAEADGRIPVLEGLQAGDRIAVDGIMMLAGLEAR
ncbi:MAG: efflux RND transporter periplasmic adaptor subunit [Acidobacteriota bacterium]|nr:efflux RND transporter periplasmic adaptor subunit [Acidobacteriota bacterium]